MSDLIDRSALPTMRIEIPERIDDKTCRILEAVIQGVKHVIDSAPTVDAVAVVRCERCRAWDKGVIKSNNESGWCHIMMQQTRPDFYCGFGPKLVRKDATQSNMID